MKRIQTLILIIALVVVLGCSLEGVGLNPIRPYHLNKGKLTKYLFSMRTQEEITSKAKIRVTFPAEFDQSEVASRLECMASSDSYSWKTVECSYISGSVVLILGVINDQKMNILISSPKNPTIYSMSSYFSICLMYDNSVTSCNKEFGKVVFPLPPFNTPSSATMPNVTSLSSRTVGKASTYQIRFSTTNSYSPGITIRVTLPPGYTTTASPICQMTGTYNQIIKTFVWPNQRSIECQLVNKSISVDETLKIIGIYNPNYAGVFGNTNDGFILQILEGTTTVVLQEIFIQSTVTIRAGQMVGSISQANRFIKAKAKYTFYLNLQNALISTDFISIQMSNSWAFYDNQCSVVSGIILAPGNSLICKNSSDATYSYLKISNFVSASVTNQLVFNIYVGTPLTIGNYPVKVNTANSMGVMDEISLSVSLNKTYGALDMLSINAITANSKVPVGKTGPLELSFFLNYQLPQTNVLTNGVLFLKIYPQIPLPPPLINGVLKCYFFNDIPAQTCTWDTSDPLLTKVTIRTPETHHFQYSEIPITITTEGAVNDSMIGITIDDKVTRYRFELEAYTQNNATTPTEVYYSEYIADAIELPLTLKYLTNEVSERTNTRIEFTNPYSFLNPLMNNLRFKIEFLAGGGWAENLGYSANTIYKRFPCVFYYDDNVNPATYDSHVSCDLYTYLEGPHASLTESSKRGPYILMYGFQNQLLISEKYRLELAKFLIGSSPGTQTKIRFSIIEETPSMLTKYIQLYYNEAVLFTTASRQFSTPTANAVTITPSNTYINQATTHTNSFTVTGNSDAVVYQYDMESTPSFANRLVTCSTTRKCVYLGYPVNWVIEYPPTSSSFPSLVSSSLSITNGIYGGSFAGQVRAFSASSVTIFKGTFNSVYAPRLITSAYFYLEPGDNLFKGREAYFNVWFDAITTIPANGFIRLAVSSEVLFSPNPYCSSSNIGLYVSELGLICENENSNSVLKIYNIQSLVAGTRYYIKIRLVPLVTSSNNIAPTITIKTYYTINVDYSVVNTKVNHPLNQTESNTNVIPNEFNIQSPRVTQQIPRVNYIGKFTIAFIPSVDSTSAQKITAEFPNHSWNGGIWTTPNNVATDPLVCFINDERVPCTYTLAPLKITITASNLISGLKNTLAFSTEYLPENGIKHPAQGGEYVSILEFFDASNVLIESKSFYHKVLPPRLRTFTAESAVNDAGVQNMFTFEFEVSLSSYPASNTDATRYGRIFVEFPTVDSLGNALFASDLGGYTATGQLVGCYCYPYTSPYIDSTGNNMKCRLIKSEVSGEPAIVEILNFRAFSGSQYRMKIRMARIYNPVRKVTSVPISIKIVENVVASNHVYELYYDTFDLFMNSRTPAPASDNTVTCYSDFTADNYEVGDYQWLRFYPHTKGDAIDSSIGYYYVMKMTSDFKPGHVQVNGPSYCHSSYHIECMAFPDISYYIIWSKWNGFEVRMYTTYPSAISQSTYQWKALIWHNQRYRGIEYINIDSNCNQDFMGTLQNYYGISSVESSSAQNLNKRKFYVRVDFRVRHAVPKGGSIVIVWPSSVPNAYPHCRSMNSVGSALTTNGTTENGEIGCQVQNSRNWVITEFDALPAASRVIITGYIDLPSSAGYLGASEIVTFNGTHDTDIRANGFIIDYRYDSNSDIYVNNYQSVNTDTEISLEETLPLRVSYTGPLQFKFKLASVFTGPNNGKIRVRLPKRSVYGVLGGFGYDSTKKLACKLKQIFTHEEYGCIVTSVTSDTTANNENTLIEIISSSTLLTTSTYSISINTYTGIDPEGLLFPTVAGNYKVDVSFDTDNSGNFNIHNHLYLQVYGTPFKVLSIQSFNTLCNDVNLIWVKLTPTTTIAQTDQIVIEIPTRSTLNWNLLANDLGTGIEDGGDMKIDIIGGTFSQSFMKCRLYHGDQANGKPARVICSSFTESIENNELLYFAFNLYNPCVSPQVSVPFFIYSNNLNTMFKSNFNTVENVIYIRNTYTSGHDFTEVGNIVSAGGQMQIQNSYIEMIGRNLWATTNEDFYLLYFNFPIRVNGIISNACIMPNGTVYGNAYYHENLRIVACDFTVNNMGTSGAGYVTRNLRILGFYIPISYWGGFFDYFGEKVVIAYHYYTRIATSRCNLTDGYPVESPKQSPSATLTITPISQASRIRGSYDDNLFQFRFSSSATVDISYMKLIAINTPAPGVLTQGTSCTEAPGSLVEIERCWVDMGEQRIYIVPVEKTSYTSDMVIKVVTQHTSYSNNQYESPHPQAPAYQSDFAVFFYSWGQNGAHLEYYFQNYCYLAINQLPHTPMVYVNHYASSVHLMQFFHTPHQRYYKQTPYSSLSHYAPFEFLFYPDQNFPTISGSYHKIEATYGTIFGDNSMFKIRDLEIYRPVCYINSTRVKKCTIDTVINKITMSFQFALTINTKNYITFALIDPRNQDIYGFLPFQTISDIRVEYVLGGSSTVYYTESEKFPTLFSLPTGTLQGPFRGILNGAVKYGHALVNEMNAVNMLLTFNRTDITSLVFEIPLIDNKDNYLYSASTQAAAFLNLEDGAPYPCGNNGYLAGGNVKCFVKIGKFGQLTLPTRIIMTDFTYVSQMNCRFIFRNPETVGSYFSIRVKAYGGTKSATNLYGNKLMGEWQFDEIFKTISSVGLVASTSYDRSVRLPSQSPWRNNTIHYVFSRSEAINVNRISMASILTYDSGSSYGDKEFCQATLGSSNDYDDLLEYTQSLSGRIYKYAYFIREWAGAQNNYPVWNGGWDLRFLKCKFYQSAFTVYWFFADNSIEIATNTFTPSNGNVLSSSGISAPINKYYDQSYRFSDGTDTYHIFEMDITPMLTSLTNFEFRNNDEMVMAITYTLNTWTSIISCNVLGGIISTSSTKKAYCEVASNLKIVIRNIGGIESDPLLSSTTNKRVKFMFLGSALTNANSFTPSTITISLFANYDAYSNNYQAVVEQSTTEMSSCFYAYWNGVCYLNLSPRNSYFQLQRVEDTFMQVAWHHSSNMNFGGDLSYHIFDIQFFGFNYGAGCTVTDFKMEISTSNTPGTGTNNTIPYDSASISGNRFYFAWHNNIRTFSSIWGGVGAAADNIWSTSQYVIFYITIAPGAAELPALHHEYIYAVGSYSHYFSGSWISKVTQTASLPSQNLATGATISTITTNRGGVTELGFEINSLKVSVGSGNTNYLLLAEFIGSTGWTGSSDPFSSYTNTALTEEEIECKCISAIGSISITATSPYTTAKCRRRLPVASANAYAILIDFNANFGEDLKCFFPEFKISSGMSFSVEFKVIYGNTAPPDLTNGRVYGSVFRKLSNTLTFSGASPSMSLTSMSPITESPNFYSSSVNVGSTFSSTYSITGTWGSNLNSPYIYINYRKAGPVPATSFCSDSNFFYECRVYNNKLNIVIARLKSSSVNTFTLSRGSEDIFYPSSQYSVSSEYDAVVYVGTSASGWQYSQAIGRAQSSLTPISTNSFRVYSDLYGSSRSTFDNIILISMSTAGKTLYRFLDTNSKIEVTFSGITQKQNCQVWVQNQPSVELVCKVTTGLITIYSERTDFTTSNNIFVTLGIQNPLTTSVTFTMKMYDYYYSAARYSLVISTTTTLTIDNSFSANVEIAQERVSMLPFRSRITVLTNAPFRVGVTTGYLATPLLLYPTHIKMDHPQFAYSSNYLIYFTLYSSKKSYHQQTTGVRIKAPSFSLSGNTLTATIPKSMLISVFHFVEVEIMPIGVSNAGCAAAGMSCASQTGFSQINWESIYFSFFNLTEFVSGREARLYKNYGSSFIALQEMYLLTSEPNVQTSMYFKFLLDFNSSYSFPDHFLEIQFPDLDFQASVLNFYKIGDIIPCQLSPNFARIANRKEPFCQIFQFQWGNGHTLIKILNIGPIVAGSYWVTFDNSFTFQICGDLDKNCKFDAIIRFIGPNHLRYETYFRQIFLVDGSNSTNAATLSSSFSNPSITQYGSSNIGTLSFSWPFDTTSSGYESKIALQFNQGFSATWANIDAVTFLDGSGTYQLLWVNKKLNKFVFAVPSKSISVATLLNITGLSNPYPYQKEAYNQPDGTQPTIEINFYNNFYHECKNVFNQPAFSIFTKPVAIVNMDQNLPSNTFDSYPATNKIGNGGTAILRLGVVIGETQANIIARKLDILDIQFTAGVSYLEECRAVRNSSLYVNPMSTCQTYNDGTWHVVIYHVTESQMNANWWVQVVGTFSSTSIAYTSRLKASNKVVEYESPYPVVISNYYSTSKSIPTTLSWLNRKYVKNFYEVQVRFLEAVAGQTTPCFKVRLTAENSFDGSGDFIRVHLQSTTIFSSVTSSTNLICQLLPSVNGQRDFSIGYYAECSKSTDGNGYHYYHLEGPVGGWIAGNDYLLQISELNPITSSFNGPVSPKFHEMTLRKYEDGTDRYDTFYFNFYQYFTSVQMLHTTTTVNDYDTVTIKYTPKSSVAAGSSSEETVLMLEVSGLYHEFDGGLKAIFAADGKTILSGARFSESVSNPSGNQITSIKFAQYSQKMTPLRFSLAMQQAYTAGTAYIWRIPLIKNPATPYVSLRYNLTLMKYPSSQSYGYVVNKHQCINEYYTQADTSTSFSPTVTNVNRNVQMASGVDLSIDLASYSLAQWNVVTFKLDNSNKGVYPNFASCNDTTNYDYFFFHTINMVMAQKKTFNNSISTVGIGSTSSTINYQRQFRFSWVKVFDTSNTMMTTNPKTIKVGYPPALITNYLTTYTSAVVTKIEGSQYQGSAVMYRLNIAVPTVPKGGQIDVVFDNAKISSDSSAHCRVSTNFVKTTDDQVLRCYRVSTGFTITGFNIIASGTTVTLYFYLKSIAALTAENIAVNIYGIYGDATSIISQKSNTFTITHIADSYPSLLNRVNELTLPYYSSIHYENYYTLEGNLNVRNNNFFNGDSFQITDYLAQYGNTRFIIKKNDSTVDGWIELSPVAVSSSQYRYYLPTNYEIDLTFTTGSQYIWKYTTTWAGLSQQNGFVPAAYGTQKIWYEGFDGSTRTEVQYFDFVADPKPFVLTITNRYPSATRKTMLEFTFGVDVQVNPGDWCEFTFDTNNLIDNMFANDLEDEAVPNQIHRELDCREWSSNSFISSSRMRCVVYYGNNAANPPIPAKLIVPLEVSVDGWSGTDQFRFMIANVRNPTVVNMNVGVQMNIFRACDNTQNKNCSIFAARGFYVTKTATQNIQATAATFTPSTNNILDTSIDHQFQFVATAAIGTSDVIYIAYPQNFRGVMPSTCSASNYYCYAFPKARWIVLIPTTTVIGGAGTLTINLVTHMNNGYYTQAFTENFVVTVSRGSGASVGDVYNILQNPFVTIKRSLVSGVATAMTIAPTQNPSIWLRNYANTAIFLLDNIFMDSRIKSIYIVAPTDVVEWELNYCNATLTSTEVNTYPLRFICRVFTENTTNPVLQITVENQDLGVYASGWQDLTLQVHGKFTIKDFDPGQPVLYTTMPVTSGVFHAYGSVNTTSVDPKYYLSQCTQTIQISQHQVPIISDITFDEKSFAYRVARVSNKEVFYMLLKPTVSTIIEEMIFEIPVEFDYPGVFTHDNCFMIGRTKENQDFCKQSREGGKTLIKVIPQNYNNEVKIIQLGSLLEQNWFTAPKLPGNFYNMTVELYAGGELLEKQTINISPIYGQYFDIPSIVLDNIRDGNIAQSVYDFQFRTGSLQIPPGTVTTATTLTSELRFIFENYNANNVANVFKKDLGTGLAEGSQIGCVIHTGMTAVAGKRIICKLHIGTNSTDKPMITILNYGYIDPYTTIKLSFAGIQSLDDANVNTISIGVLIHYTTINSSTYLYIPTATLPDQTNNTLTLNDRNVQYYAPWHPYWSMSCNFYGNNIVRQPTNFSLSILPPNAYPYGNWMYSSTGVQDQFILIKLSPKYLVDPHNQVNVLCSQCTEVKVFYAAGIILFRHTRTLYGSSWTTFDFYNFPSSAYIISNEPVTVTVQIYDNYRLYATKTMTIASRTVEKCSFFNFGVLSVSSLNGGEIGVSYTFSLITNHYIPEKGAISITIPSSYGNMVANGVTCQIQGFPSNVYCLIQTPSRVDIYLNNTLISNSASYKVILSGLQNPNEDSAGLIFYVSSYYDDNIYLGHKICQKSVNPPTITVKAIRTCTLSWSASYVNTNFNATYSFVVSCNDLFRGDSILYIKLPSEFSTKNNLGNISCSSLESTTLVQDICHISSINGTFMLWTEIEATSQTSLTLLLNLINPTNNTYTSSAYVQSRGVTYAKTDNSYLTILSTNYTTATSNKAFLMNSPKEAGLMATYIFKISPISNYTPNNLGIQFPSNFFLAESQLTVGITTSQNSNFFADLNYDNVQKIINNISAVNNVVLKGYPSFKVETNALHMSNISKHLSNTEWTYVFIRGVKNPAEYLPKNFTLTYYIDSVTYRTLQWVLQAPLTYHISSPPKYLSISSVNVSDYDLLSPSIYTFKFNAQNSQNVAISGVKLSYIIVIPTFYKSTVWANGQIVCKFAELNRNSPCQNYESQIIITETFAANFNELTLTITRLLNPALETYCNTDDVTLLSHTFFKIRIIEVESNKFMFESSSVVDGSNCLKFRSIRIPISLEHSLVMIAGLAYNLTYGISKPASNLKIRASTTANGFTFSPNVVEFHDYYTLKKTTTIYLRSDIAPGSYVINFEKFESEEQTYFRNILPTTVQVVSASSSTFERPTIRVPSMSTSTIGYPISVPILFSLPSSTQMTFFIKIAQQSNQTLAEYSPHFSNFTLSPRIININPQQLKFSFNVTQGKQVVPPPLTLEFTISSVYPIIHNLITSSIVLCFDQDPTYDVLYPPLRVTLTEFASSCNTADVGKKITNIFISNDTSKSSAAAMVPEIVKITSSNIRSTSTRITINTRISGTVYYLCIDAGYPLINNATELLALANTNGIVGTTQSTADNVYQGQIAQINYIGLIDLEKLSSMTKYNFYAILKSELGTSTIKRINFTTTSLSRGVLMKLTFNQIVSPLDIVKSLERITRTPPIRIKVLTSTYDLQLINSSYNQHKNSPKYVYEIVISPDPTNDTTTPMNIVENFLKTNESLNLFKSYIPAWDNDAHVQYYELRPVKPRVTQMLYPKIINLYNATFNIKFWERSNIYAILVEQEAKAADSLNITQKPIKAVRVSSLNETEKAKCPTSLQISQGKNYDNKEMNKYQKFTSMTDSKGNGVIVFVDLKPGSIYNIFLTSSSYIPYNPPELWSDAEVILLNFQTLYNPNLAKSQKHIDELKKFNPGLGGAIQRFLAKSDSKKGRDKYSSK